jgi:ribosomal protein L37AE/L43A
MQTNYFYCEDCRDTTRHIEISAGELTALVKQNILWCTHAKFADVTDIDKMVDTLDRVMVSLYKCPKCSSNDVEPDIHSYICNKCGYKWGTEELLDELEEENIFKLHFN